MIKSSRSIHGRPGRPLAVLSLSAMLPIALSCTPSVEHAFPPVELLVANLDATDVTVILEIADARKRQVDGGYATWSIDATVVRSFKGRLRAGEAIAYPRTMEAGIPAPRPGTRHIVSFVWRDGVLFIPDMGYHFPCSKRLERGLDAAIGGR